MKNIAKEEGISVAELDNIQGSGKDGRVTKEDILKYIEDRKAGVVQAPKALKKLQKQHETAKPVKLQNQWFKKASKQFQFR